MFIDFFLRERNTYVREKLIDHLPPVQADRSCNLRMCPDKGFNLQPFGVQDNAPTNQGLRIFKKLPH